jgi:predicted amidophosphoribosyltransferase
LDRAIAVRRGVTVPESVILVDDIWTSGATFSAAARALLAAGCRRVGAVAVAREPLQSP